MARQPTDQYMPMFIVAAVRCRPGEYLFSSKDSQNAFCPTVCTKLLLLLHIQRRHQKLFHQNWKILLINSHRKYAGHCSATSPLQQVHPCRRFGGLSSERRVTGAENECTETARLHSSTHGLTSLNITPLHHLSCRTLSNVLSYVIIQYVILVQVDRSSNPKCGSEFQLFVHKRKKLKKTQNCKQFMH
ncbi:hypothetical protein T11_14743 [Trichinella zimbabwensis]|uniref:Uncharacterized protein n=1 Tax=Trichinella zimbabwensis TaxID=268475 RepID=A0A0V1HF00_9BILA|nr:hypothetical protein T11_14743 [Trichinella zimbabwensis]